MSERRKLRIGLLQDRVRVSRYTYDLITWAAQQDDLEITHLIIQAVPGETRIGRWRRKLVQQKLRAIRMGVFNCILLLERAILRVYHRGRYRDHLRLYRVDHLIQHTVSIHPIISEPGSVYRFSAEDIDKIRASGCDVLIQGGGGSHTGEILEACRFGILSLYHGDNRINRGGPAGFWESYLGWPATGFVIQRLTGELDGGDVLLRGSYFTHWFFLLNQAAVFRKSSVHFQDLLKRLARERTLPRPEQPAPYSGRLFRSPSVGTCFHYLARVAVRFLRKGMCSIFRYRYRWSVSFIFAEWRRAAWWRAITPTPPAGRFLADPFLWHHEGKTHCLVEDYSFRDQIGRISVFQVGERGSSQVEPVLTEPFHLSFPYLFTFDDNIYMCPECRASGEIRLYRAIRFPHKWEYCKTIMSGVLAADTMLFHKGDRWWMLTNLDRVGDDDFSSELYLFSAESPLSETWTPHPANPLKIDPVGGRNAGLLREGDRLFRAGQVHGFDYNYGAAIRVHEICSLSPEDYREHLIAEITPGFRKRLLGTHHLCSRDGVTVVDSVRREFVW